MEEQGVILYSRSIYVLAHTIAGLGQGAMAVYS